VGLKGITGPSMRHLLSSVRRFDLTTPAGLHQGMETARDRRRPE
jgi:hypothetical protein